MTVIVAPSVPHCGHHFLMHRVLPEFQIISPWDEPVEKRSAYCAHFDNKVIGYWPGLLPKYRAVVTLRHPRRVLESFRRRETVDSNETVYRMHWKRFLGLVDKMVSPLYLHLDAIDVREREAERIRAELGLDAASIEWDAIDGGKKGTHDFELTAENISEAPQEFVEFYEATIPNGKCC